MSESPRRFTSVGLQGYAVAIDYLAGCAILARSCRSGPTEISRFLFAEVGQMAAIGAAFMTAVRLTATAEIEATTEACEVAS